MRNLKKFLALVMAMVMAFSLMVSASAANTAKDFDDAASITEAFVEATDVLTGMKVFQGDEEAATFRPADTITRAEVAALIYRLATGDVDDARAGTYANYGNFADVAESDWFAGYVGFCANAGYIKGHGGYFNPYDSVTGYEALAMILRAIGYDKNGEFTGPTWETNVSALATQLGILTNIKTTHYGNTLYLASRRDVVAELLFQADAKVPMVIYTPAFGYQPYGMTDSSGGTGSLIGGGDKTTNPTLGKHIFGLTEKKDGVLLGNEQTGEGKDKSVLGYAGKQEKYVNGEEIKLTTGDKPKAPVSFSAYTWDQEYDVKTGVDTGVIGAANTTAGKDAINAVLGDNIKYELKTGIDLVGHKLRVWYDNGDGVVSNTKKHVFAYFDEADTAVIYADTVDLTADPDGDDNITQAIKDAGFKLNDNKKAVWNNSFGKFGTLETDAEAAARKAGTDQTDNDEAKLSIGDGVAKDGNAATDQYASPVNMYKIIDNNGDKKVDAIIALNVESSRVTESNAVNRVPTIGVPVDNRAANTEVPATGSLFIEGDKAEAIANDFIDKNLKGVPAAATGVVTGVLAKDALVGNSASALGEYEMGIHVTGTTRRDVSTDEATAINNWPATAGNPSKELLESSYFLLNKVEATVEGTVVAYNIAAGTVTLDNGTVLERSPFYHTVVGWSDNTAHAANPAPASVIPQSWTKGGTNWEEGYANVAYKFYTDYEGKYLGAERTFGSTFLYGTYLDYSQETSSSTFNYYLTGVDLNGETKTVQVKRFWDLTDDTGNNRRIFSANDTTPILATGRGPVVPATDKTTLKNITGTNQLWTPYRDSSGTGKHNVADGAYMGFAITGDLVDGISADLYKERNEYLNNMARLGIKNGATMANADADPETAFARDIVIGKDQITLGAVETVADTSNKYFTEATKFILVEGFGTDSVKAEVYTGISELRGTASRVTLNMDATVDNTTAGGPGVGDVRMPGILEDTVMNSMTYYTESPYTYAQSGQTAMKVDTIILPKAAVSWAGGNGVFYVGDPTAKLANSWGIDAWKYTMYNDGEAQDVWLTNQPGQTNPSNADNELHKDSFYNLKDTGKKANDGQPIYTAGNWTSGTWTAGDAITSTDNPNDTAANFIAAQYTMTGGATNDGVRYSAVTRDAQTATFVNYTTAGGDTAGEAKLYRVAEAKVVNLNKGAKSNTATLTHVDKCKSGEIWPNITDLATLNEAGSISPVTGRALKVAAVVDPDNPLVITTIYVCWDQDFS